jgi:DNA-binding MarR family transcriptional regulator
MTRPPSDNPTGPVGEHRALRLRSRGGSAGQLNRTELLAWRGMLETHAVAIRELDAELRRSHGLPLTEYDVLYQLAAAPRRRLRMMDLADAVLLTRGGVTRLVDRLVARGLVKRVSHPGERAVEAELTDEGMRVFRSASRVHFRGVRRLFLSHFTSEELDQLAGYWRRVGDVQS